MVTSDGWEYTPGSFPDNDSQELNMRPTPILAIVAAFTLVTTVGAEPAYAPSGHHPGRVGQRADADPAPLTEADILESFDDIVGLIWTDSEENAWSGANTEAAKQAFAAAFWADRDPTPDTADNEYREVWMVRVMEAYGRYADEGAPGYATPRGQFHLIYGPMAIVAAERNLATARGGVTFTIDTSQNRFLDGARTITFLRLQGRTYTMTTRNIALDDEAFRAGDEVSSYFAARQANPAIPGLAGPSTVPGGVATMVSMEAMDELLGSGETRQDLALKQQMSYIPAQQGATYAIFNFEVGKDGLTFEADGAPAPAWLRAFGVLLESDSESRVRELTIDFNVDPDDGSAEETSTHSFGMTMVPGSYRLAWGVIDVASNRLATTSYEFEVPDFSGGELQIPSVLIASGVEQMADAIDVNTIYKWTRVGNLELRTDIDNVFARNDMITMIYFVRGAATDAATRETQLEIGYRILSAEDERSVLELPSATMSFFAVQQDIPLAAIEQLEPGKAYEIEIHIRDLINGNELTHTVPFTVASGS